MKQPRIVLFALILILIFPSALATSPVPVEKHRLQGEIGSFHIMEGQDVLHPDQRDAALELGFGDQLGYVTIHTPWNKPFSLAFVPELGLCLEDGDSLQWVQLRYQGQALDAAGITALLSGLLGLSSENFEEAMEQKGLEGLGLLQDVLNKLAEPLAVQALVHKIQTFNPLSFSISTSELYTAFQQALILVTREAKQWAKAIAAWLPPTLQVTEDDVESFLTSQSYALLQSWQLRRLPDVLLHASLEGQDHLIYLGAEEMGLLQLEGHDKGGRYEITGEILPNASQPMSISGYLTRSALLLKLDSQAIDARLQASINEKGGSISASLMLRDKTKDYDGVSQYAADLQLYRGGWLLSLDTQQSPHEQVGRILISSRETANGLQIDWSVTDGSYSPASDETRLTVESLETGAQITYRHAKTRPFASSRWAQTVTGGEKASLHYSKSEGSFTPPAGDLPALDVELALSRYFQPATED